MKCWLLCLLVVGSSGCARLPPVERPGAQENISAGLAYAAVYLEGRRCVGEFRGRDGSTVRPELPRDFCALVRAAVPPPVPKPEPETR